MDRRDLGRHIEQGMRHLTGNHIGFIDAGDGDDHIGLGSPRSGENVGIGRMPRNTEDVMKLVDAPRQLFRLLNHRDIMAFGCEALGDGEANTASTADYNAHGLWDRAGSSKVSLL